MRFIVLLWAYLLLPLTAHAEMVNVSAVESLDGAVKCIWARDRVVSIISGPCENFTPPTRIRLGETFIANGKTRTIGIITATHIDKDMSSVGLKAGDTTCVAAESSKEIPDGQGDHVGTWLYIKQCRQLNIVEQQPPGVITPIAAVEFLKIPNDLQAVYVGGIMEGESFLLYGTSNKDSPAWIACVQQKTLGDTTNDVVAFIRSTPNFTEGVGSALAQVLGRRCRNR